MKFTFLILKKNDVCGGGHKQMLKISIHLGRPPTTTLTFECVFLIFSFIDQKFWVVQNLGYTQLKMLSNHLIINSCTASSVKTHI
jgi:hypothetical protein